jgi:antitoxin ParD1/3/4
MGGRNFSLTEHLSAFVDRQVKSGRHQNASEVIREALRRYEDDVLAERASLSAIKKIADTGAAAIDRGDYVLVDGDTGSQALLRRLTERAAKRVRSKVE